MGLRMRDFNIWGLLKIPIFKGGPRKTNIQGDCLKKGVGQFDLRGGVEGGGTWQERGGGVFERRVDTPMHIMDKEQPQEIETLQTEPQYLPK